MKALIYSLVRPLAEPAEPRLPVFRFIHGRDYYHVFAIAKTRKYDQGGNKRSLGAKTRSSSAPTRYAARLLKGRNDGDHFFCGKRPFDLSPDLGRGLLLRIPPHERIGRCHGLARGAPQSGSCMLALDKSPNFNNRISLDVAILTRDKTVHSRQN